MFNATSTVCMAGSIPSKVAVLTGDIIGSSQMAAYDRERAFQVLERAAQLQTSWHQHDLHFSRQRGDGWQVHLAFWDGIA